MIANDVASVNIDAKLVRDQVASEETASDSRSKMLRAVYSCL